MAWQDVPTGIASPVTESGNAQQTTVYGLANSGGSPVASLLRFLGVACTELSTRSSTDAPSFHDHTNPESQTVTGMKLRAELADGCCEARKKS